MSRKSTGAGISSSGAFSLDIFNDNSLRMLINTVTVLCLPFLSLTRDHHILSEGNKDSYCVLSKSQPICCYNPTSMMSLPFQLFCGICSISTETSVWKLSPLSIPAKSEFPSPQPLALEPKGHTSPNKSLEAFWTAWQVEVFVEKAKGFLCNIIWKNL